MVRNQIIFGKNILLKRAISRRIAPKSKVILECQKRSRAGRTQLNTKYNHMNKNYYMCFLKHRVRKSFMGWLYNYEEHGELVLRNNWVNLRINQINKQLNKSKHVKI